MTDLATHTLDHYAEHGFAMVRGLFDAEEVEAVRTAIGRIVDAGTESSEAMIQMEPSVLNGTATVATRELGVRKLFRMAMHDPFFRELARHNTMAGWAHRVLGGPVMLMQSMLLMKPPVVSGEKVWHQDNAYFRLVPNDVIGFWVACDDTNVDNGCMHVVPGSHRSGILPHTGEGDLYGLAAPPEYGSAAVLPVPLRAGDALLFHGELCHGTPPNQTDSRRRALQYHYAALGAHSGARDAEIPEV